MIENIGGVKVLDVHGFYQVTQYAAHIQAAKRTYDSAVTKPQYIMFFCNQAEYLQDFLEKEGFTKFVSNNYANHAGRPAFAFIKPIGDMFK